MTDLTLPIIALTTLTGYFFNKEKTSRNSKSNRTKAPLVEKSNGDNIYNSNMIEEVNREMLERSFSNYKKAEHPEITGVLPPLFNTYNFVGNDTALTQDDSFGQTKPMAQSDYNLIDSSVYKDLEIDIDKRPMFANTGFTSTDTNTNADTSDLDYTYFNSENQNEEISLLTGLPLNKTHNNMVPFFGSNVKQNVETFRNESLLDNYTGNKTTFQSKREIGNMFNVQPENIYGTPLFTDHINTDRFIPSVFRQNEKPFNDIKVPAPIAGTIDNNIRPTFKSIDELRVGNKLQQTYEGRVIAGQQGSIRGIQGKYEKKRPDTFYESGYNNWFKTTGQFTAPKLCENYSNMNTSNRGFNNEHFGIVSGINGDRQRTVLNGNDENNQWNSIVQEPKRLNFENNYLSNVVGRLKNNDYGLSTFKNYETERVTTESQSHLLNPQNKNFGIRTQFFDKPKTLIKETTLYSKLGNVKTTFDKGNSAAFENGISDIQARITHKQMNILNNYKSIASKEKGMGYLVNKCHAPTTSKEITTNNSNYIGNVNFTNGEMSRENFDNAEIKNTKETSIMGSRLSTPQFQLGTSKNSLGDLSVHKNTIFKERENIRNNNINNPLKMASDISHIGKTRFRKDNCVINTRLTPDLISGQHSNNPYSIWEK